VPRDVCAANLWGITLPRHHTDRLIAELSGTTCGVVCTRDLLGAGISESRIRHRVGSGRLVKAFNGVFLVGHPTVSPERLWWAGLMAAGPGRGLSRRSVPEVLGLLTPQPWAISVTAPYNGSDKQLVSPLTYEGRPVRVNAHRTISASDVRRGTKRSSWLPTQDIHDALFDVAGHCSGRDFHRSWQQAEYQRLITDRQMRTRLARGRDGSDLVAAKLARRAVGSMRFQNDFEEDGGDLFESFGMARPQTNVWVPTNREAVHSDFWFPHLRLVVEFDGRQHDSPGGQEMDRDKEAWLNAVGITVLRFRWRQV
jgi:hypothetical protein